MTSVSSEQLAERAGDEPPRWDVASIFPSLSSAEYATARRAWQADLDALRRLLDRHEIRAGVGAAVDERAAAALAEAIEILSRLRERFRRLRTYVTALVATDATDSAAAAERARLAADEAPLATLQARVNAWIRDRGVDALVASSAIATEHATWLARCAQLADHQLSEREEDLLAELEVPGVQASPRLAEELTSTLVGTLRGEPRPVSVLRGLAGDPDPSLRRDAYDAELCAWETIATPMAACLNAISGHARLVDRRRGWADTLAAALWANRVTPEVLDAMHAAVRERLPDFRRFLRAKARLYGHAGGLPWWDLRAPAPGGDGVCDWPRAETMVTDAFATFSPRLHDLAARTLRERWVDAGPRPGKRGGGFCMAIGEGDSRILMNFDGSEAGVRTLGHELGHAYHNLILARRPPLLQATPMALAETASTFCETIMVQAGLRAADDARRLSLLDGHLTAVCQTVVDIHSRFAFEVELYARRGDGPLSVAQLCGAMIDAQAETYGDGVDPATYHPWMWAVKPHYYVVDEHFYNWPYTFGLLFGMGLYARFAEDPTEFADDYDGLLSRTGMLDALPLAARFGIDLADPAFWRSSLDVIGERIDAYVALVG